MLKTNQDRLVMQSVLGEIQHPTVKELPVRLDCDGVAHTLPNTGSITYNVKLGDSVYGLAGDHIEPGVTIKNHNAARENEALNVLSCIGIRDRSETMRLSSLATRRARKALSPERTAAWSMC